MNQLFDILETCLHELENGTDVEAILARSPEFARELRPLLKTSIAARNLIAAREPSDAAIRRGRAKLLQLTAEIREAKLAPRKRVLSFFQRLALSLGLTATFLVSGSGLVGASASAVPGQGLYPVKRGWEDIQLFLAFNPEQRNSLEQKIGEERLHEVNELLSDEEQLTVDFSGVLTNANGAAYISNVKVSFPVNTQLPAEGSLLHVIGQTTKSGYVEIIRFDKVIESNMDKSNTSAERTTPAQEDTLQSESETEK